MKWSEEWRAEADALYKLGKIDTEIAAAVGVCKDSVYRWRKEVGYPTNHGTERRRQIHRLQWEMDGEEVKAYRERNNMTQKELGAMFGITESTVSFCEKGKRKTPPEVLRQIFDDEYAETSFYEGE